MNLLGHSEGLGAAWLSQGLFVAILAAFVCLAWAKRVQAASLVAGAGWLLGAALSLGTGIWSGPVLGVAARAISTPLAYHPWAAFGAWLLAVSVVLAALGLAVWRGKTALKVTGGAVVLGLGTVLTHVAVMLSLGLQPSLLAGGPWLALAMLAALAGATAALSLQFLGKPRGQRTLRWRHAAAALALGLSVMLCQHLVMASAELPRAMAQPGGGLVPSTPFALLASIGSMALLGLMLLWSVVEKRMRASLRSAREELQKQSLRDTLTELPNRQMFEGTLAQAVQRADTAKGSVALLFIALDGFKPINESFGHRGGDRVLREMAKRLRALSKPHMVARLGGDEFLLLLNGDPPKEDAAALACALLESINQPCQVDGREVSISCSIGIALYPAHGGLSMLISHAEAAMRVSKSNGGATYCFFEARMVSGAREQAELLRDLRQALALGQFELYYQPKIHAPSGEITGAEALMRWHHPQRGMISPTIFIPIAERFGLIGAIGNWVIDEACRQARAWRDAGLRMRVAINLSVHQLRHPDLPERIAAALKKHQINPDLLTCEITESVAMEDADGTMKIFGKLAAVGVHISIDDFGTGYSSLSYLRKLAAKELKIDRSFVLDLETSADARAVVDAVVKLAQALSLKVVAEGVETEAQQEILRTLGCHELQGFLFAKPMSAKALALWAMNDDGPRSLIFRASLFKATVPAAIH